MQSSLHCLRFLLLKRNLHTPGTEHLRPQGLMQPWLMLSGLTPSGLMPSGLMRSGLMRLGLMRSGLVLSGLMLSRLLRDAAAVRALCAYPAC